MGDVKLQAILIILYVLCEQPPWASKNSVRPTITCQSIHLYIYYHIIFNATTSTAGNDNFVAFLCCEVCVLFVESCAVRTLVRMGRPNNAFHTPTNQRLAFNA